MLRHRHPRCRNPLTRPGTACFWNSTLPHHPARRWNVFLGWLGTFLGGKRENFPIVTLRVNGPFSHTDGTRRWPARTKNRGSDLPALPIDNGSYATSFFALRAAARAQRDSKEGDLWRPPKRHVFLSVHFLFLCNTIIYMLQLRVLLADPQPPSEFPRFLVPTSAAWHRVLARAQNASRKRSIASASE